MSLIEIRRTYFSNYSKYSNLLDSCIIPASKLVQELDGPLQKENLETIRLKHQIPRSTIIMGGKQALFAWHFEVPEIPGLQVILKPYSLSAKQIALHIGTVERFEKLFGNKVYSIASQDVIIRVLSILGIGTFKNPQTKKLFSFLIQEYSSGHRLETISTTDQESGPIPKMGDIFRELALGGFILDPYMSNWRLRYSDDLQGNVIEYLDLLFFSVLDKNLQTRVENIFTTLNDADSLLPV